MPPTVETIVASLRRAMAAPDAPADVEHTIALGYITGILARPTTSTEQLAAIRDVLAALDQVDADHADGNEWTTDQVLAYLADQGRPIGARTWSGYVTRGQAPAPARRPRRTPVWDPATIRAWHTSRCGQAWRADQDGDQP